MHERMNQHTQQQFHQAPVEQMQPNHKGSAGEYIDFEEIKD